MPILWLIVVAIGLCNSSNKFIKKPRDATIDVGGRKRFECLKEGEDDYLWKINDVKANTLGLENLIISSGADGTSYADIFNATIDLHLGKLECQAGMSVEKAMVDIRVKPKHVAIKPKNLQDCYDWDDRIKSCLKAKRNGGSGPYHLVCTADGARPKVYFNWYKNGRKLSNREFSTSQDSCLTPLDASNFVNNKPKLCNFKSVLLQEFSPLSGSINFTCSARIDNGETIDGKSLIMEFSVPQEKPVIKDASSKLIDSVISAREGETLRLVCTVEGGNSRNARVYWTEDGRVITSDFSVIKSLEGKIIRTRNLSLKVKKSLNGKEIACFNGDNKKAAFSLNVLFKPPKPKIFVNFNSLCKKKDSAIVECFCGPSNPAFKVTLMHNDQIVKDSLSESDQDADPHTYTTYLRHSIKVVGKISIVSCSCNGQHSDTKNITQCYPPKKPTLNVKFQKSNEIYEKGSTVDLICNSDGGYPRPSITWKEDGVPSKKQAFSCEESERTGRTNNDVCSKLTITFRKEDNGKTYSCVGKNVMATGSESEYAAYKTFNITYFPDNITLTSNKMSKLHETTRFICTVEGGNPHPNVTFRLNETIIRKNVTTTWKRLSSAGKPFLTTSVLDLYMNNGLMFRTLKCLAKYHPTTFHPTYEIVDELSFRVDSKPFWISKPNENFTAIENKALSIVFSINGRPSVYSYSLLKNGSIVPKSHYRVISNRFLNLLKLKRYDHGSLFTFIVSNSHGNTQATFRITVNYKPEIKAIGKTNIVLNVTQSLILTCHSEGRPTPGHKNVYWRKKNGVLDTRRFTQQVFNQGSIVVNQLNLTSALRQDDGQYQCHSYNTAGVSKPQNFSISVNYPPIIQSSDKKFAADYTKSTTLICKAIGRPSVKYNWFKLPERTPIKISGKFSLKNSGNLKIDKLSREDYGFYLCQASNLLGNDTKTVELALVGPPDKPFNLSFSELTPRSLTVSWSAGFNGGLEQTFEVKYAVFEEKEKIEAIKIVGKSTKCALESI
ncbi:DgyrCDS14094 [Dimorphilus gyrociliatus]|uniref:DgyrCDS14094 n=1 Tax=Dimorphilus gyrociliatus TaxID=2664684 RepID=A0A7I8WCX8_9ANNE|nr:DgyrCDS14094 [Dimorphilus gyrociliatus]